MIVNKIFMKWSVSVASLSHCLALLVAWPLLWLALLLNLVVHHIPTNQPHLFMLASLLSQLLVFHFVKYSAFYVLPFFAFCLSS